MKHAIWMVAAAAQAMGQARFEVSFPPEVRGEAATGRVVVMLIRSGAGVGPNETPLDGPFWFDPQPMFGMDVRDLKPGTAAVVNDGATAFPAAVSRLPAGRYRAQARLDMHRDNSDWKREPGNLYSDVVNFTVEKEGAWPTVELTLTRTVEVLPADLPDGFSEFEVRSDVLSKFRGREVRMRASVAAPIGFEEGKTYPAIYHVPGFGGDHGEISFVQALRAAPEESPAGKLARSVFVVTLDPEGPNGHTLFVDSANNGPCGAALVEEFIPALEARFALISRPEARLVRGHSSGGWSAVWLAVAHPSVFEASWSSAPDPVDFRRFQLTDIYGQGNMYLAGDAPRFAARDAVREAGGRRDAISFRTAGVGRMTVRDENLMEEVLGPDNTSGQQWDSWQAVFGARNARGNPAALFDPVSGEIDPAVAATYRAFDISRRLEADPGNLGPVFKSRIRLVCGVQDSFFLNEAAALLKERVDGLAFLHLPEGSGGYVKLVRGDHGSVLMTPEVVDFPAQMMEHLRARDALPRAKK